MTRLSLRRSVAAAVLLTAAGCGSQPLAERAVSTTTTAAPSTAVPTTSVPASLPATTTPAVGRTSVPTAAATSSVPKPPPVSLGPEWTQSDGRVRIEATASGDPQALLRDLQALGLRDGVVFGRVVNGWLPVESFDAAQRLASLQLVRPTGAGTG